MNSPIDGSNVYPLTLPYPLEITIYVLEPYKQYPAEINSVPFYKQSLADVFSFDFFLKIANIEPIDTLASILLEPSRGSKHTI